MTRCRRRRSIFELIAYSSSEIKRFSGSSKPVLLAYCLHGQLSASSSTSFSTCLSGVALVRRRRRRRRQDARRTTTKQYTYAAQTHTAIQVGRSASVYGPGVMFASSVAVVVAVSHLSRRVVVDKTYRQTATQHDDGYQSGSTRRLHH